MWLSSSAFSRHIWYWRVPFTGLPSWLLTSLAPTTDVTARLYCHFIKLVPVKLTNPLILGKHTVLYSCWYATFKNIYHFCVVEFSSQVQTYLVLLFLPHLLVWGSLFLSNSYDIPGSSLPCTYHYSIITIHMQAHTLKHIPPSVQDICTQPFPLQEQTPWWRDGTQAATPDILSDLPDVSVKHLTPQSSTQLRTSKHDAVPLRLQSFPCWPACGKKKNLKHSHFMFFFSREPRL